MKYDKNKNKLVYINPLPLPVLPPLFVHNPVSWLYFLYSYFFTLPSVSNIHVIYKDSIFSVVDRQDQLFLWRNGFFGKGNLSRSEPTWFERTEKRLGIVNVGKEKNVSGKVALSREDITSIRRDERQKFKSSRQELHDLTTKSKLGSLDSQELAKLQVLQKQVDLLRNQPVDYKKDDEILRDEDLQLIDDEGQLLQLEFLQLQPVEVFFLKFGLNVIDADLSLLQLFDICCKNDIGPANKFILDYVVYHHYRSLGWCVRPGIKFGCDVLLYKRGPPFSHAEHAILIVNDQDSVDWFQLTTLTRVIGTVKKNLVLVFVSPPTQAQFDQVWSKHYLDDKLKFHDLFQLYKVSEIIYRRWAPSRTRD